MKIDTTPSGAVEALEHAFQVVCDLDSGKIKWTMSVPTRPDSDPDLIIATAIHKAKARIKELEGLINAPETDDFLKGVKLEAAHQVQRWGYAHDRSKSAENWYWLVGYLAGKALRAAITGDQEKALHHTISSAAALLNWHAAIKRDATGSGVGQDADLVAKNPIDAENARLAGTGQ